MKNLSEIQLELRNMVNQIEALSSEIENLKPKDADEVEIELIKIEKFAEKQPIKNSQLRRQPDLVKKLYFQFLALVADKENLNFKEQLLFIKRIAVGVSYNKDIMGIIKDGMDMDESFFDDIAENLSHIKESLLLDALIAANITGTAAEEKLEIIAAAAEILGSSKEDLTVLSKLASSIIQHNVYIFSSITCTSNHKWYGKFTHYIPKDWLVFNRVSCGEYSKPLSNSDPSFLGSALFGSTPIERIMKRSRIEVKKRVDAGTLVKKGETIVEYEQMNTLKTISAPKDGMVFFTEVKGKAGMSTEGDKIKVYLVSCFDEYNDFYSWLEGTSN